MCRLLEIKKADINRLYTSLTFLTWRLTNGVCWVIMYCKQRNNNKIITTLQSLAHPILNYISIYILGHSYSSQISNRTIKLKYSLSLSSAHTVIYKTGTTERPTHLRQNWMPTLVKRSRRHLLARLCNLLQLKEKGPNSMHKNRQLRNEHTMDTHLAQVREIDQNAQKWIFPSSQTHPAKWDDCYSFLIQTWFFFWQVLLWISFLALGIAKWGDCYWSIPSARNIFHTVTDIWTCLSHDRNSKILIINFLLINILTEQGSAS